MFTTCLASARFSFFSPFFSNTQNYFYLFSLINRYYNLIKADYIFHLTLFSNFSSLFICTHFQNLWNCISVSLCLFILLLQDFYKVQETSICGHSQPWCSRVVEDSSEKSSIIRALITLLLTSLLAINPIVS